MDRVINRFSQTSGLLGLLTWHQLTPGLGVIWSDLVYAPGQPLAMANLKARIIRATETIWTGDVLRDLGSPIDFL